MVDSSRATFIPYVIAQVVGSILAAAVLYAVALGKPDWVPGGFASNGYGDLSPGKYGLVSRFLVCHVLLFVRDRLTLIHLFLIPVTLHRAPSFLLMEAEAIRQLETRIPDNTRDEDVPRIAAGLPFLTTGRCGPVRLWQGGKLRARVRCALIY